MDHIHYLVTIQPATVQKTQMTIGRKDPLIRFRKYLTEKDFGLKKKKNKSSKQLKKKSKQLLLKPTKYQNKGFRFLENMFEVSPQSIKEQIAIYEAKESK